MKIVQTSPMGGGGGSLGEKLQTEVYVLCLCLICSSCLKGKNVNIMSLLTKPKKKDKHSFRWLHNVILLRWRCWRWTLKGKTQYCFSTLKFSARCSNWQRCPAFGHPERERETERDSERVGGKKKGRKRETLFCKESCDRAKVTSQCNY